jgi:FMN phosphatase YigB (HAD superfamily)
MSRCDLSHIRAVLFDLDGTLVEVRMDEFIPRYVAGLAERFSDLVPAKKFTRTFLDGIRELIQGPADGTTNETRLLRVLERRLSISATDFRLRLRDYRDQGIDELARLVMQIPHAVEAVDHCRRQGLTLVLATNPVFPLFMIDARRRWSGLDDISFDHVSSYENSRYCKPSIAYFEEIAEKIGVPPAACLMIGNDSCHDLAATGAGMTTYLVDTFLVERPGRRWPSDYRGNHTDLLSFLRQNLPLHPADF